MAPNDRHHASMLTDQSAPPHQGALSATENGFCRGNEQNVVALGCFGSPRNKRGISP